MLTQEAASAKNRKLHPWIITMGHRPMYCSNSDGDDCTKHESVVSCINEFLSSTSCLVLNQWRKESAKLSVQYQCFVKKINRDPTTANWYWETRNFILLLYLVYQVRGGLTSKHLFPLEDLFYKYGMVKFIVKHQKLISEMADIRI